ncbi:N-formylglutamate amidohydrolase [Palleronia marisminoris]|uniref:N-formylglutamate amidohydrolase n=1 Tax=Palleronia marisminoris TaxID=315423 RepID=A0A1Y5STV4_9RHOB|nr:N-formylglutamate amidohydrolase [Palleronia marisminoris]SFG97536.1 N-formylglutamate amidohydrolase [Palleronia marisminoris]SLN47741.1 N-formylglutamate amidohydrolase [Palleronia marisminoris]
MNSEVLDERAYDLHLPERRSTALVFASPHSGCHYPDAFVRQSILPTQHLRSSEDAHVDKLFRVVTDHGAPLLAARMPRAWLDVNRSADELDPALIEGQRRGPHNPRVASGLGVVPRVVSGGRAIYSGKLPQSEARARLRDVWYPYHGALRRLVDDSVSVFGRSILVDCHSMPHEALDYISVGRKRPDIVLGDRFGAAASGEISDLVEAEFTRAGFTVSRNAPFAGAFIAQHYGRPRADRHVIQVEIDRATYMDEATLEPHSGYDEVKARIADVVARLCAYGQRGGASVAAE